MPSILLAALLECPIVEGLEWYSPNNRPRYAKMPIFRSFSSPWPRMLSSAVRVWDWLHVCNYPHRTGRRSVCLFRAKYHLVNKHMNELLVLQFSKRIGLLNCLLVIVASVALIDILNTLSLSLKDLFQFSSRNRLHHCVELFE
jgi:hypothetical protein